MQRSLNVIEQVAAKVGRTTRGRPGLGDTDASGPWFDDMSGALSPDEAAADVLWLATLPAGIREPYGELVQHREVLPFTPA